MATTSPDNLRTPDPGDSYNLVADLATLANDTQTALNLRDNTVLYGTSAQRGAAESTATEGMLWVDTDGIKMIWRRGASVWEPAVWDWSGTNTQMTGFAAPDGFKWFNTTDNNEYIRLGGAWVIRGGGFRVVKTATPLSLTGGAYTDIGPGFVTDRSAPGISWTSDHFVVADAGRYSLTGNLLITTPTGFFFTPNSTATVTFPSTNYSFMSASSAAGEMGLSFNVEMDVTAGGSVYLIGLPGGGSAGTLRGATSLMKSWVELKKVS